MTAQGMTSGFAFSGNPVIFTDSDPSAPIKGVSYKVTLGGKTIYEGKYSLPATINLSEVIDSEIPSVALSSFPEGEWLVRHNDMTLDGNPHVMQVIVEYDSGADWESLPVRMLRGRIPSPIYTRLTASGTDYFTERLLNPEANFFLTTRTSGTTLCIPETELMPLCFLSSGGKKLTVEAGKRTFESETLTKGIYWLDLDRVRRMIFDESKGGTLVNEFKVGYSGSESRVTVVVTYCEPALERVVLRYRNSLDIPEMMAFEGSLQAKAYMLNPSEEYLVHSAITDDYNSSKEGDNPRLELTLDTGPVNPGDLPRLMELIHSRHVDLISPVDGSLIHVIPAAEDFSFPLRPEEPQSYEIALKVASEDLSLLGLLSPDDRDPWRIFSKEHNDKFN